MNRSILRPSMHTSYAVTAPRPRLRGWLHLCGSVVVGPLAVLWTLQTVPGPPRLAVAAFAGGVALMLTASAILHLRRWSPSAHERLLRLDHTGIYLAISGTGIALGILGLSGAAGRLLVLVAVVAGLVGIVLEWLPFAPPRGFSNAMYLTIGWMPVVLLPWLWMQSGPVVVSLLLAGGISYTVGAVVVGLRRPNPSPRWFGYHEIFHALVIVAVALHATMVLHLARG